MWLFRRRSTSLRHSTLELLCFLPIADFRTARSRGFSGAPLKVQGRGFRVGSYKDVQSSLRCWFSLLWKQEASLSDPTACLEPEFTGFCGLRVRIPATIYIYICIRPLISAIMFCSSRPSTVLGSYLRLEGGGRRLTRVKTKLHESQKIQVGIDLGPNGLPYNYSRAHVKTVYLR